MTVTFENQNRHATGAISTFVFTLTGTTSYDLTAYYPDGYTAKGFATAFESVVDATGFIYVNPSTDVVTCSGTGAICVTVFAKKE